MTSIEGASILLLEDEFMISVDAEEILLEMGARDVAVAATLEAARERMAERNFDVAILDVNINGHSSFEFAEDLMARGVPFVFATGYELTDRSLPPSLEGALRLTKPYTSARLREAITAAIVRSAQGRAGAPQQESAQG